MNEYLTEDHSMTKNSLKEAQKIREESKKEMQEYDVKSVGEIKDLESQVQQMQQVIGQHEREQANIKTEN